MKLNKKSVIILVILGITAIVSIIKAIIIYPETALKSIIAVIVIVICSFLYGYIREILTINKGR